MKKRSMKKSILAFGAITVLSAPLLSANIPNAFAASSSTKSTTAQVSKGLKTSSAKVDAPKNVILFIGDGMGEASRNAIRLATAGKSGLLEMDNMPVT
ncbi:alkaline phosphatase, partial [Bacillus cereus]|nr:alkaline phosphatase [Bacillus cereus]